MLKAAGLLCTLGHDISTPVVRSTTLTGILHRMLRLAALSIVVHNQIRALGHAQRGCHCTIIDSALHVRAECLMF